MTGGEHRGQGGARTWLGQDSREAVGEAPLSCSSCCVLSSESPGLGEDGQRVGGTWGWAPEQPLGPEGALGPGSTGTRVQIPAGLHDPEHVISLRGASTSSSVTLGKCCPSCSVWQFVVQTCEHRSEHTSSCSINVKFSLSLLGCGVSSLSPGLGTGAFVEG